MSGRKKEGPGWLDSPAGPALWVCRLHGHTGFWTWKGLVHRVWCSVVAILKFLIILKQGFIFMLYFPNYVPSPNLQVQLLRSSSFYYVNFPSIFLCFVGKWNVLLCLSQFELRICDLQWKQFWQMYLQMCTFYQPPGCDHFKPWLFVKDKWFTYEWFMT